MPLFPSGRSFFKNSRENIFEFLITNLFLKQVELKLNFTIYLSYVKELFHFN